MNAIRTLLEFNFKTFDTPRPKVLVISHERSGTHFLMNTLAANFGYVSNPFMNLDWSLGVNYFSAEAFKELFIKFREYSVANVFKSHHTLDFYRDFLPQDPSGFKILYIYRDVYEVQVSYHGHLRSLPWNEGPSTQSLSEFIRRSPSGAMTRYQFHNANSMVERWVQHVESALRIRDRFSPSDFMMINYKNLHRDFDGSVTQIGQFLGLSCPEPCKRPLRTENVVPPVLGLADQEILKYYSSDDIEFVERVAGPTRERLAAIEKNTSQISLPSTSDPTRVLC